MGITYLSKTDILAIADLKNVDVEVPEWGGVLRLQSLNAARRERWETVLTNPDSDLVRATLVALSVVDENGALIFNKDDIQALAEKSYAAMNRVYEAAVKLNTLDSQEAIEKN